MTTSPPSSTLRTRISRGNGQNRRSLSRSRHQLYQLAAGRTPSAVVISTSTTKCGPSEDFSRPLLRQFPQRGNYFWLLGGKRPKWEEAVRRVRDREMHEDIRGRCLMSEVFVEYCRIPQIFGILATRLRIDFHAFDAEHYEPVLTFACSFPSRDLNSYLGKFASRVHLKDCKPRVQT